MNAHGARRDGIGGLDQHRQVFVFDRDQFGGVLRDVLGLGDDQRDRLADKAHALVRKPGADGTRSEEPPTPLKNAMARQRPSIRRRPCRRR